MSASATHVTLEPSGALRTLFLQEQGRADIILTVRGEAPNRVRYEGRMWQATLARLHRSMRADGYEYRPVLSR